MDLIGQIYVVVLAYEQYLNDEGHDQETNTIFTKCSCETIARESAAESTKENIIQRKTRDRPPPPTLDIAVPTSRVGCTFHMIRLRRTKYLPMHGVHRSGRADVTHRTLGSSPVAEERQ